MVRLEGMIERMMDSKEEREEGKGVDTGGDEEETVLRMEDVGRCHH
jgi:hypothetical protein